ncbi:hypothetical protein [Martelella alba]|uniref:DUF4880 domain-containing protein n=1 Tax=Martelella alba TaxID=2590451 RepID=A0ABY2SH46_9HYPH|nr:hypothetical protein [Martelella alba]TKI04590.1 hypothetical protein FCN80_17395 [Martelella alba]
MTPERFRNLVEIYGADAHRWPERERAQALTWAAAHPGGAERMSRASARLDRWLDEDSVPVPSAALMRRIVASAPGGKPERRAGQAGMTLAAYWWAGAAFVCVGLAGGLAGAFLTATLLSSTAPSFDNAAIYMMTSFSAPPAEGGAE